MRLITWNCNMAFRKKAPAILKLKPDILVVPECECPDHLQFDKGIKKPTRIIWFGNNRHKGLGIFSYSNLQFRLLDCHNPDLKTILPIEVTDGTRTFHLFGIWANHPADKPFQYVGQIWKALSHYSSILSAGDSLLAGDFNSNTIWDKPRRSFNHSHVVQHLQELDIRSCYHQHFKQEQGKEKHPTQYMYRHRDKPYHLDYCFASKYFADRLQSVRVGSYKTWSKYSDHVPVVVDFNLGDL
jgi:exodeoxyribonuclease-3